jgi:predicted nuclease of predicted toxin-antitoxin system
MLRLLTDEDFDGRLTSALLAHVPGLDLVRVQDVGLMQAPDPDILAWAAGDGRIVLTHDRNTMTGFASARVHAGQPMPGLVVVARQALLGRILNDLEAMAAASEMDEWRDQIIFVPL